MVEKFTFDIQAPKISGKKIILVKKEVELREHVVMKLLAYALYYDPELKVEVSAGLHFEPDLFIPAEHLHSPPKLWIECGKVGLGKVESLAAKMRHTRIIFIKETKRELSVFKNMLEKKVERASGGTPLEFVAFEPEFVSGIAAALEKNNQFTLYPVMENVIGVAINDQVFESEMFR